MVFKVQSLFARPIRVNGFGGYDPTKATTAKGSVPVTEQRLTNLNTFRIQQAGRFLPVQSKITLDTKKAPPLFV